MGKIVEILEAERKRPTAADFDVVHMYKTGQFYTAYDWSAWIISVISYTDAVSSINSYLGVLSHSASYNIRHHLFEEIDGDIIKAA